MDKIRDASFPCVAAKAALNKQQFGIDVYSALGDSGTAESLCRDLDDFFAFADRSRARYRDMFITYVAVFSDTVVQSEREFHDLMWRQLQLVRDSDRERYRWDPKVSSDVTNPEFSFSIGGCAFFVVGMKPVSSRLSRRFPWPALVFNPGAQFEALGARGLYDRVKASIRRRDVALQGSVNPRLVRFGHDSVALTYSGADIDDTSLCPLEVRAPDR